MSFLADPQKVCVYLQDRVKQALRGVIDTPETASSIPSVP